MKPSMPVTTTLFVAAGTVDDEQIAAFIPAADDADVFIAGVEYQIAGQGIAHLYRCCIRAGWRHLAVADDVLALRDIVEYPIHKAAAIQP